MTFFTISTDSISVTDMCILFLILVIVMIAVGILFSIMRGRFFWGPCRPPHRPWHDETERELRELRKEVRELKREIG